VAAFPGTFARPRRPFLTMIPGRAPVPVLEARDLSKRYSAFVAVRGINFSIRPGEILGVLGPNGAGKSTIVKMITGLVEPTSGGVWFDGERLTGDFTALKQRMGYVPEQPDLYGFLTGWEYLDLVATMRGIPAPRFREKASAMLQGFRLFESRDVPIHSYSKGMRQRIVLMAAFLHDPAVLVLDEPFSGLDVTSVLVLRRVIERLADEGKAIFFSSPVLEQVDRLCSHLVVLNRGAVVASGSMEEMHAGFAGIGLEAGFMQLTEQVDTGQLAEEIVAAVLAPAN